MSLLCVLLSRSRSSNTSISSGITPTAKNIATEQGERWRKSGNHRQARRFPDHQPSHTTEECEIGIDKKVIGMEWSRVCGGGTVGEIGKAREEWKETRFEKCIERLRHSLISSETLTCLLFSTNTRCNRFGQQQCWRWRWRREAFVQQ